MSAFEIMVLAAIGLVGGLISSLLGGASIITFPVLVALGLPPITASAVNLLALTPGNLTAVMWDRGVLPPLDRSLLALVVVALAGALIGALLLAVTPVGVFEGLVPLLLAFSTVLFAKARTIGLWLERRRNVRRAGAGLHVGPPLAMLFPVSVYGGFFGAGLGVLLIGVLSIGSDGDYRRINALKNLVNGLSSMVACAVYASAGLIVWPPALVMLSTALVGSYLGVRIARMVPREAMRVVVIAASTVLTLAFAWRYWL